VNAKLLWTIPGFQGQLDTTSTTSPGLIGFFTFREFDDTISFFWLYQYSSTPSSAIVPFFDVF
jgi:hypothetical protein